MPKISIRLEQPAGGKRYSYAERAASIFWFSVNFDDGSRTLKELAKEIIRATDGACEALKTLITTEEIQHLQHVTTSPL